MDSPLVLPLVWQARTKNRKTGDVPTACVGRTIKECRDSCLGCPLLDGACYAWAGLVRVAMTHMERRYLHDPGSCSLEYAIQNRHVGSRMARIGAIGDPARADPEDVLGAVNALEQAGLAVVSYTHFWRDQEAQFLKSICLASCSDEAEAQEALELGWKPAPILPWDYEGKTFKLPGGGLGLVCPAQLRKTTCNECLLCWTGHKAWGRIAAVGFIDHSRAAAREARSFSEGQAALFAKRPDTRGR